MPRREKLIYLSVYIPIVAEVVFCNENQRTSAYVRLVGGWSWTISFVGERRWSTYLTRRQPWHQCEAFKRAPVGSMNG